MIDYFYGLLLKLFSGSVQSTRTIVLRMLTWLPFWVCSYNNRCPIFPSSISHLKPVIAFSVIQISPHHGGMRRWSRGGNCNMSLIGPWEGNNIYKIYYIPLPWLWLMRHVFYVFLAYQWEWLSNYANHHKGSVINEPVQEISNNVVCVTSIASDQPAHMRSLIRAFASHVSILWLLSYWLNTILSF